MTQGHSTDASPAGSPRGVLFGIGVGAPLLCVPRAWQPIGGQEPPRGTPPRPSRSCRRACTIQPPTHQSISWTICSYPCCMSSRITSELGTLGDRIARMRATEPARTVRHVLARDDAGLWQPALLVGWFRAQDRWWGRVAMLDGDHDAALVDLAAGRLRPSDCSCCQSGTATT